MKKFGHRIRTRRTKLQATDSSYSLRQVSQRIGIEPSYLSKIERGLPVALSEEKIIALAEDIGENADYLLALGGKISNDVKEIIKKRPMLFSHLVREMASLPDEIIEAKTEFQQIQGKIHRLHDLASMGSFQFNANSQNSYWSQQIPSILHISDTTSPSLESLHRSLTPASVEHYKRIEAEAFDEFKSFTCELELAHRDPLRRFIQVWVYFEQDEKKDDILRLGIIQDATETIRLRMEIQAAKASLQTTVDDKELELLTAIKTLKEEIRQRKKLENELQEVNRSISAQAEIQHNFFKEKAYMLRSLMNMFVAENSVSSSKTPSRRWTRRISAKINDMSDFFENTDSRQRKMNVFNIRETLETIGSEFKTDFEQKDLNLLLTIAPNLSPTVIGDKRRFEQVFIASLELFLTNTPWGNVQTAASSNSMDDTLILSISSSSRAHSVQAEHFQHAKIMNGSHYRINPIHLVDKVMKILNGRYSFENPEGGGTVLSFHIPMKKNMTDSALKSESAGGGPILVVEDDIHSLIYISRSLEKRGFSVVAVKCGHEALHEANHRKYMAILLDIQLPDIDGVRIAQLIQKDETSPNRKTPLIAITAHAARSDRDEYLAAGINGFIEKPFEISTLLEELALHANDE